MRRALALGGAVLLLAGCSLAARTPRERACRGLGVPLFAGMSWGSTGAAAPVFLALEAIGWAVKEVDYHACITRPEQAAVAPPDVGVEP